MIGVLIHDHYTKTGNLEHVDALLRAIQARGCVPYALSDSFASDHTAQQGMLYRMARAYRRADGSPIPAALVVSYGFSLTTLSAGGPGGPGAGRVFEDWGLPGHSGAYDLIATPRSITGTSADWIWSPCPSACTSRSSTDSLSPCPMR